MSSFLKETENPALPAATPAAAGTPVAKGAEEHTRPQPVALEIPVTVNGARTVEGSDKREPFSETTKTVLVFGHGAVVRVSSPLAAGQLVFLTNEKTKKEVVCQVVKSKNQGSTNGYVELQFTESAPGYWGMRFPGGNSAPAAVAAPRPVATAVKPVVPAAPAVAALPPAPVFAVPAVPTVVVPPTLEKNVATPPRQEAAQPALVPEALPVTQAAKPMDAPNVKVLVEKIPVAKTESLAEKSEEVPAQPAEPLNIPKIAIAENPSLDDLARQLTKELLKGSAKELPMAPKAESPKAELPQASSEELAAVLKETGKEIPVSVAAPETGATAIASNEPSSEALQQKTVQLQAQLSSLLFEDASKPGSTVVTESHSLTAQASLTERPESTQAEAIPAQPLNSRPSSLLQKPLAHSIAVEEVKIPSWLAPLARETDFRSMEAISADATKAQAVADLADLKNEAAISETAAEDAPHEQQTVMFGGLIDAASPAQTGSKKGLWIGIAAAALLVAGGVWYANQPDNLLTGVFASKPVARPKAAASDASTPFRNEVSRPAETGRTSS